MTKPGAARFSRWADPGPTQERMAQIRGLVAAGGPQIDFRPIRDLRDLRVLAVQAQPHFPAGADRDRWFADARDLGVELELELAAVAAALSGVKQALPTLPADVGLWVDVSPATVRSPKLGELLAAAVVPVTVSVREQAVGADPALRAAVTGLRGAGGRFAVSGVAAGYPGLRYVLQLDPDVLKLDRGLIHDVHRDLARTELARAVVRVAHHLGASLVADGIEQQEDVDALLELGITAGQGPGLPDATPPSPGSPGVTAGTAAPATGPGVPRDLAELVRPVLELVIRLTGLETAYLTVLDPDEEWLEHRFVCNTGTLQVPEGLTIPWIDSLCKRCRDAGLVWTADVRQDLPPIPLGRDLPIRTFVSVPVVLSDGRTAGTLCAMGPTARHLDGDMLAELAFFARLLADRHSAELGGGPVAPLVHGHQLAADAVPRSAAVD